MSGIYLHIPFCKQACSYCDFYFVTRQHLKDEFVDKLIEEITSYRETDFASEPVETIYFGGGTPSLLSPQQISRILAAVEEVFTLDLKETTLEMNPDDVTEDYLSALFEAGISRASMGVQTLHPELLQFMNRAHTRDEALRCLELLSSSSLETFTVDLIYGNPGQTLDQLEEDINEILQFDPPHISAYSLTIESGTRLGKQVELNRIIPPEDDVVAEHFRLINNMLREHGIHRYEVSNYSKSGAEAVHNSHYWEHQNYLGLGPGAHSFWWNGEARRWQNKADISAYLQAAPSTLKTAEETLSLLQLAEERLMMGLRNTKGLAPQELTERYQYELNQRQRDYIHQKKQQGIMQDDSDRLVLTEQGIIIADAIILDIITLH